MRTIGAAGILSLALLLPGSAVAQSDPGETPTQQEFRQSVEALPPTTKRRNIVRAEGGGRGASLHRRHRATTAASGSR
jgi:hypothetical protein